MRRLLLLRHTKSDWPEGVEDIERPLNARGRRDAAVLGAYLVAEGLIPDAVLCSPALRTQETWAIARHGNPALPAPRLALTIYEALPRDIYGAIREQDDEAACLLVVGHNPGLELLASDLIADGPTADRRRMAAKYPTGGLAVIDLSIDAWAALAPKTGRLERFVAPRLLAAEAG